MAARSIDGAPARPTSGCAGSGVGRAIADEAAKAFGDLDLEALLALGHRRDLVYRLRGQDDAFEIGHVQGLYLRPDQAPGRRDPRAAGRLHAGGRDERFPAAADPTLTRRR